jgi:Family of unknown function (DUF5681)
VKTADTIEEIKASSEQVAEQVKVDRAPQIAPFRWVKGQSGNPGGRPKKDFAAEFARKVLEAQGNEELLAKYATGFARQLAKGNAYTFKELAERGYGKLKETKEVHVYDETPDADLNKRIADLERDLGLARQIDEAGRAEVVAAGAGPTNGAAKDPDVLSR